MATIKPEQAQALLGKGLISNEFYDTLVGNKGKEQAPAIQETAKVAEEELKAVPIEDTGVQQDKAAGYYTQDGKYVAEDLPKSKEVPYDPNAGGSSVARASTQAEIEQANSPQAQLAAANDRAQNEKHFADLNRGDATVTPIAPSAAGLAAQPDVPVPPAPQAPIGPPEAPPGAPVVLPEQTIKPAAKPTGAGGIALPKSEQQAYNAFMERTAAETVLQARQSDIDIRQADANANAYQQGQDAYKAAHATAEADRAKNYAESLADIAKLDKLNDDNRQANMVDQERHWSHGLFGDNRTANKITAGLGILLGGFGQGLQQAGGNKYARNAGVDALNGVIERDLAAQKADAETRNEHQKSKTNLVTQKRALYKDKELGDAAAAEQIWTDIGRQIQTTAAKSNSETARVNADKAMVGIAGKVSEAQVAKQARMEKLARQNANAAYSRSLAGQYDAFIKRNPQHPLAQMPRDRGMASFAAGGAPSANVDYQRDLKVDPSKEKPEDKIKQAAGTVIAAADELEKLHAKSDVWSPEDATRAAELQETIRNGDSVMSGQGIRDKSQRDAEIPLGARGTRSKVSLASLKVLKDKAKRIAGQAPTTKIAEE